MRSVPETERRQLFRSKGTIGGDGHAYDEQNTALARGGASVEEAIFVATTDGVRDAADIFRPISMRPTDRRPGVDRGYLRPR